MRRDTSLHAHTDCDRCEAELECRFKRNFSAAAGTHTKTTSHSQERVQLCTGLESLSPTLNAPRSHLPTTERPPRDVALSAPISLMTQTQFPEVATADSTHLPECSSPSRAPVELRARCFRRPLLFLLLALSIQIIVFHDLTIDSVAAARVRQIVTQLQQRGVRLHDRLGQRIFNLVLECRYDNKLLTRREHIIVGARTKTRSVTLCVVRVVSIRNVEDCLAQCGDARRLPTAPIRPGENQ